LNWELFYLLVFEFFNEVIEFKIVIKKYRGLKWWELEREKAIKESRL
jgi:hypothetical protein